MLKNDKVSFLNLPTPVEYLPDISQSLGVEFYIKRDDLTGLGAGGNKLRKLEYFLKDAQKKNATMLLTVGGAQTNHGRLTAAVAAKYGMKCAIVCDDKYPGEISANILLDRIMGADVILRASDENGFDDRVFKDIVKDAIKSYEDKGERVYYIPMGGSNEIGEMGYYECAGELIEQCGDGHVITTVGSMGTYMGLFCGLHGSALSLTGVLIGPFYDDAKAYACEYFESVKKAWGLDFEAGKEDFDIRSEFVRGGYNNANEEVRQAIYEMARKEAIILDPCYTGKTYAAIKDMIRTGDIKKGEKIIFIHTGGMPGLNAPHHRKAFEEELMDGVILL